MDQAIATANTGEISAVRILELLASVAGSTVTVVAFIMDIDKANMGYPICAAVEICNQKVCISIELTQCFAQHTLIICSIGVRKWL